MKQGLLYYLGVPASGEGLGRPGLGRRGGRAGRMCHQREERGAWAPPSTGAARRPQVNTHPRPACLPASSPPPSPPALQPPTSPSSPAAAAAGGARCEAPAPAAARRRPLPAMPVRRCLLRQAAGCLPCLAPAHGSLPARCWWPPRLCRLATETATMAVTVYAANGTEADEVAVGALRWLSSPACLGPGRVGSPLPTRQASALLPLPPACLPTPPPPLARPPPARPAAQAERRGGDEQRHPAVPGHPHRRGRRL